MKLRIAYTGLVSVERNESSAEQDDFLFICPSFLECVLAAGDTSDIPALDAWLTALPSKSYGRVFIEIEDACQRRDLDAPPGVGITWLVQRPGQHSGAALGRAIDAWLDEWLRGDPLSGRYVHLWSGARGNPDIVAHLRRVEVELADTLATAAAYRDQLI